MITSPGTIDGCLSAASSCAAKGSERLPMRRRRRSRPGATGALAATSVLLTGLPDFGHSNAISASSSSTRGAHAAFVVTSTTATHQHGKTSLDFPGRLLGGGGILVRGPRTRPRGRDSPCRWRAASSAYCNCVCRPPGDNEPLLSLARGGRAGISNAGRPSCSVPLFCSYVEQDAAMLEEVVETAPDRPWQLEDVGAEALENESQAQPYFLLTPIPKGAGVAAPTIESAAFIRRQRKELETQWLEDFGQDVPFEFADMRQEMQLPCSIQLVPRVERKSLVYVNGTEASSRKDTTVASATAEIVSKKAAKMPPINGSRVASLGGSVAAAATAAAAAAAAVVAVDAEEAVGEGRRGGLTRGELNALQRSKGETTNGDTIRLIGEMDISKPGYLKVQEGKNGRSDTLLVSQFGLTRGGTVSRLDLDPSPRLPRLFTAEGVSAAAAGGGGGAGGLLMGRTQPRLTGTWGGPLVWPNEINQVPPAAVVRLTQGEDAESRYLESMEILRDGRGAGGGHAAKKKTPVLRLEAEQFSLLRLESDKFVNGDDDIYTRPTAARPPREEPHAATGFPRVEGGTSNGGRGEQEDTPSDWDGPLPEQAMMLVADGFLVPGKSDGGVYVVVPDGADKKEGLRDPAARAEESGGGGGGGGGGIGVGGENIIRLTSAKRGWFYHKAVWLVLPGGKKVVLTARVHKPLFGQAEGELVLLEMPQVDSPLAEHNLPWRERVLVTGPDVMFEVVDLDPTDCTVQVICAEFFGGKLTMHSLWGGGSLPGSRPSVTESWVLDYNAGPAYSVTAADLRGDSPEGRPTHFLVTSHESSYDYSLFAHANAARSRGSRLPFEFGSSSGSNSGSISESASQSRSEPRSTNSDSVSDRGQAGGGGRADASAWGGVVTGVEERRRWERCAEGAGSGGGGGALLAYEIPEDWRVFPRIYPSPGWNRVTLASGFRVRGLSINPGTPGFPYVFHPHKSMEGKRPPYIAIAGDCSQSAYILRPVGAEGLLPLEPDHSSSVPNEEASSAVQEAGTPYQQSDGLVIRGDSASAPALALDEGEGEAADAMERKRPGSNPSSVIAEPPALASAAAATSGAASAKPKPKPEASSKELKPVAYEVACSIVVPGTVGSLAVSYGPLLGRRGTAGATTPPAAPTGFPSGVHRHRRRRWRPNGVEGQQPVIPSSPVFLPPGERHAPASEEELLGRAEGEGERGKGEFPGFSAGGGGVVGDVGVDDYDDGGGVGGGGGGDGGGGSGWAKLFVPNYDGNKVYVFSMEPAA